MADPRGGNAMRVKLDPNTIRTNPGGNNGIVVIGALSRQVDNACISYDVKFDADFDWSKAGKLPGLIGVAPGVPPSKPAGGHPAGDQGWSGRLMWFGPKTFKSNGRTNTVVNYMYSPNQKTEYGDDIGWNAGFTQGKWHNVKQCYTMNTVGQANGIIRGYLDGKQVLNQTDYVFRTRPASTSATSPGASSAVAPPWTGPAPKPTPSTSTTSPSRPRTEVHRRLAHPGPRPRGRGRGERCQ